MTPEQVLAVFMTTEGVTLDEHIPSCANLKCVTCPAHNACADLGRRQGYQSYRESYQKLIVPILHKQETLRDTNPEYFI